MIDRSIDKAQVLQEESTNNTLILPLLQILGIILVGAVAAFGKKATLDLGIPGHSALLWLSAMIAGRAIINRDGAGLSIGVCTALWGMPVGFNHSLIHNVGLYGAAGVTLDIVARLPLMDIRKPLGIIVAGLLAHSVKFCFIIGRAMMSVTAKRFILFGVIKSAMLHLAFGLGAGLIGVVIYYLFSRGNGALEKMLKKE